MATILVTDGEQRSALATTRSLGRAGHRVIVLSASGRSLAGASRHAARDVAVVPAGIASDRFAESVARVARDERADLVFPIAEEAMLAVLAHRDAIPAIVPFADLDRFRAVSDKNHVLEVATTVGIRVPVQWELLTPDDPPPSLQPPLVLKPTRSVWTAPDGTRGRVSVSWVHRPVDFVPALRAYPAAAFPVLAQEAISGPGVGVFLLLHEGSVLARFAHERVLEKPPSGGASVVSRSRPIDEELYEKSVRLLEALGWSGVAMVEYKRDIVTDEPVLMEINGRFWGSLQLAIDAGVDFPALLAEVALGGNPDPVLDYHPTRMRWEWGHVDHLVARLKSVGGFRVIPAWLAAFAVRGEVCRVADPGPFARETVAWVGALFKR